MYNQITSNRQKSWFLILIFTGILAAAGYLYGYLTHSGYSGLVLALMISLGMTLISWFAGDKIALWQTGAHELIKREQNPYIWNLIENLCITAGLPRPRIYLIDDPSPNAFATGRDPKHASIALTTGLIERLENEELEGVIAHELSHIKNLDIRFLMLIAVMVGAITILGDFFIRGSLFSHRGRDRQGGHGIMILIGILFFILAPLIGELIKLAVSRRREYLADASGALLTRYPEGLARALEKIRDAKQPLQQASTATAHLWIASPFGEGGFRQKISSLLSTHPPIEDRIKQLRAM
ncbi:MAG: M48 family metalloprotease [Candidatus Uhrbacteria bacterium]|nr:M48 family metalloprotease [Candidatus Uhrbacteria bacterium]